MTTTIAQKIAAWPQWKRLLNGWFLEACGQGDHDRAARIAELLMQLETN